jgi:hypothetical protein
MTSLPSPDVASPQPLLPAYGYRLRTPGDLRHHSRVGERGGVGGAGARTTAWPRVGSSASGPALMSGRACQPAGQRSPFARIPGPKAIGKWPASAYARRPESAARPASAARSPARASARPRVWLSTTVRGSPLATTGSRARRSRGAQATGSRAMRSAHADARQLGLGGEASSGDEQVACLPGLRHLLRFRRGTLARGPDAVWARG